MMQTIDDIVLRTEESTDPIKAVNLLREAAEQGNADAQYYSLGECYFLGNGVEKKIKEAIKWWRMAADQGNAKALGKMMFLGAWIGA
jgi:TPR repeat protein